MVAITLNIGESISVAFANTDGEFLIAYDTKQYPKQLVVKETAGLRGSVKGDANEIVYHEDWRRFQPPVGDVADEDFLKKDDSLLTKPLYHGWFCDARGHVHHTDTIHCVVREYAGGHSGLVVITLDSEDNETGEFTFYSSLQELDAQTGVTRALKVLP